VSKQDQFEVEIARGEKPVAGIKPERIIGVEEEVMRWTNARHIHGWFVDNVQHGKNDYGSYALTSENLFELYSTCERVLNASQLVRKPVFEKLWYGSYRRTGEAEAAPRLAMRNVAIAHKLLPTRSWGYEGAGEYDEQYIQAVRETRDWAERMLDDVEAKVPGTIYYSSTR